MTKDAFITKRKSDLDNARTAFTEFGINYIQSWTKQELAKYRAQPVVIPIGDYRFFVGPFQILGLHQHCWSVEQFDGKHKHDFVDKTTAILYCLYETRGQFGHAANLLELDKKIGKLSSDITYYQKTLSTKKTDNFKKDVAFNRLLDAKMQRNDTIQILKKTLISAKYFNFRNNSYETNRNGHQAHSKKN
jgi:hypothetical protein